MCVEKGGSKIWSRCLECRDVKEQTETDGEPMLDSRQLSDPLHDPTFVGRARRLAA